jgi:hypothetical protein
MDGTDLYNWTDTASYEDLLRRWRFAAIGDPIFQGEVGKHYAEVMAHRRAEVGPEEHTRISKRIGWER